MMSEWSADGNFQCYARAKVTKIKEMEDVFVI